MSRKSRRNRPDPGQPASVATQSSGRRGIVIGLVIALVVAVVAAVMLTREEGKESSATADTARQAALTRDYAPAVGDPGAKVHIVEFIDPACETCAQFYPLVKQLVAENPGKVRLSLRHVAFHQGSDYALKVLEASRRQDKYWETLQALLGLQGRWVSNHVVLQDQVVPAVSAAGLDLEQLLADMDAPEVAQRMNQDFQDATTLKVTATPEFFVNGRPLPSFGFEQLIILVQEELQKAY